MADPVPVDAFAAMVRAAVNGEEAVFVNVIAFSTTAGDALLALSEGDSVTLAGTLTPKVWTDKNGDARPALDMVAHAVLTAYHVKRKREAMQASRQQPEPMNGTEQARRMYGGEAGFDDDL